ncbi:MAG: hypothetical protein U0694_18030 [Anaerolineae bacterium]
MQNTAVISPSALIIKRTQEQRGSELQAGARAELAPSSLNMALSSLAGRLSARTMIKLFGVPAALNFITARIDLLAAVMKRSVPPMIFSPLLVDLNAGFSPLGLALARDLPSARVIELDTPEVIHERERRLRRARAVALPPNLATIAVDLEQTPLIRALLGQRADVMTLTGGYMTHDELLQVVTYLMGVLTPTGSLVVYLPWQEGIARMRYGVRLFKRQVGELPGAFEHADQIQALFRRAGYSQVTLHYPNQLATALGLPTPLLDLEVLVQARRVG